MRTLALIIVSVALFLAAAKTHGRQLRLERELEGHWEVTFGAKNAPFVEELWRRDRIRFWIAVPVLAALGLLLVFVSLGAFTLGGRLAAATLAGLLWAPSIGFMALASASFTKLARSFSDLSKTGGGRLVGAAREAWIREAIRESAAWFGLVVVLACTVGWTASKIAAR